MMTRRDSQRLFPIIVVSSGYPLEFRSLYILFFSETQYRWLAILEIYLRAALRAHSALKGARWDRGNGGERFSEKRFLDPEK